MFHKKKYFAPIVKCIVSPNVDVSLKALELIKFYLIIINN